MISISKLILSIATFAVANGYAIPNLSQRDGKFFKLDFNVTHSVKGLKERISSSESPLNISLSNQNSFYSTNLLVGSQGDQVSVDLDTGSSDLFFPTANSTDGYAADTSYLHSWGVFNAEKSTSLKNLNEEFFIQYGDGSFAYGNYVTDNVGIPNGPTVNVEFGHAVFVTTGTGILGIGYADNEATQNNYPNYPQVLKSNGIISKVAYSLYLNAPNATDGSIIFGGIDTAKYKGALTPLNVVDPYALAVNLDTISIGGKETNVSIEVLLDSGTTITYLPDDALNAIYSAIPGNNTDYGYKVTNPDQYTNSNISISYHFKNATINVPVSSLISEAYDDNSNDLGYKVLNVDEGSVLGDNFLRWAYVVYDLDDKIVSLAPVKFTDETNIIAIN